MINKKTIAAALLLVMSSGASYAATGTYPATEHRPVVLVNDSQDVVHDEATGTVLHSTSGACVRTKWMSDSDVCAPSIPAAAPPPPPPAPVKHQAARSLSREQRTIYFAFNKADLSPEMKQRLDTLASALKSESDVKGARIVGTADRIGNAKYNEQLSKKRAENTRQYLVSKGYVNLSVAETRWVGSTEPTTNCSNALKHAELVNCLQKDRRVEVEIDYLPEVQATPDQN